jgi:hypothetical protein
MFPVKVAWPVLKPAIFRHEMTKDEQSTEPPFLRFQRLVWS